MSNKDGIEFRSTSVLRKQLTADALCHEMHNFSENIVKI